MLTFSQPQPQELHHGHDPLLQSIVLTPMNPRLFEIQQRSCFDNHYITTMSLAIHQTGTLSTVVQKTPTTNSLHRPFTPGEGGTRLTTKISRTKQN